MNICKRTSHHHQTSVHQTSAMAADTGTSVNCSGKVSDLWKRKLKTLFTCIDADGNKFINRDDLPALACKFQKFGGMSEDAMHSFTEKLSSWWDANFTKDESLSFEVSYNRIKVLNFTSSH